MNKKTQNECIICKTTSKDMPLILFEFNGSNHYICSQHIPILIHKSHQLKDILPGIKEVDEEY